MSGTDFDFLVIARPAFVSLTLTDLVLPCVNLNVPRATTVLPEVAVTDSVAGSLDPTRTCSERRLRTDERFVSSTFRTSVGGVVSPLDVDCDPLPLPPPPPPPPGRGFGVPPDVIVIVPFMNGWIEQM